MSSRNLIIGGFNKPYDEESFYNHQLYKSHKNPLVIDKGKLHFFSYLSNLIKKIPKCKKIYISSKACTRQSLLNLFFALFLSKLFRKKTELILSPEVFNFFGNFRSKFFGDGMMYSIFSLSDKIYYTNESIKVIISKFYKKTEKIFFRKMETEINFNSKNLKFPEKNIIFFNEPSGFLLELISELDRKNSKKFKIVIATKNEFLVEKYKNIYFLTDYSLNEIIEVYSKSKIILRNINCDNKKITPEIGVIIEFPKVKNNLLTLKSLVLLKKSGVTNILNLIINWVKK